MVFWQHFKTKHLSFGFIWIAYGFLSTTFLLKLNHNASPSSIITCHHRAVNWAVIVGAITHLARNKDPKMLRMMALSWNGSSCKYHARPALVCVCIYIYIYMYICMYMCVYIWGVWYRYRMVQVYVCVHVCRYTRTSRHLIYCDMSPHCPPNKDSHEPTVRV